MASVLRTGLANLNPTALLGGLCKVVPKHRNVAITQVSFISSRAQRQDRPPRPPPFDWKRKTYNTWQWVVDPMEERFDDNTKVIVVEGLPGVGKDKFARKLAEELEMLYIKPPSFDDIWIDPYGFDMRCLNPKLPEEAHFFDLKSFLENPNGPNTAAMQVAMFTLRSDQYMDALCHVLSTGQGVVIQRCPFSDANFMQAMHKNGYVSKGAANYYKSSALGVLPDLMRPHLVLYLDAPISTIKSNIKKRNIPYEANSKALTDQYLQDLDDLYKEHYLREVTKHSHLLIYDWSREGDVDIVVEDIERLDFDNEKPGSEKFKDWKYDHIYLLKVRRGDYANHKTDTLLNIPVANLDVPEMWRSAESGILLDNILMDLPETHYEPGFNPAEDKGILFKLYQKYEDLLPRGAQVKKQE